MSIEWMTGGSMLVLAQAEGSEVLGAPSGPGEGATGESTAAPGGATPPAGAPTGGALNMLLPLVFGLIIFMMITSMLGGRKEKKKRAEMLSGLKKHDRVQTYGGIIGTVMEMKGEELVLRVDESSNTRIRFSKSAVQQVLKHSRSGSASEDDGVEEIELENERFEDPAEVKA